MAAMGDSPETMSREDFVSVCSEGENDAFLDMIQKHVSIQYFESEMARFQFIRENCKHFKFIRFSHPDNYTFLVPRVFLSTIIL